MNTDPPDSLPRFGYVTPTRSNTWKWIFGVAAVLGIAVMWQCGSWLNEGRKASNAAVAEFHSRLNRTDYQAIYQAADEELQHLGKSSELLTFLTSVHAKLGEAGAVSLQNINVNSANGRSTITTRYNTKFANGAAVETFTWIKRDGILKLYGYHVLSDLLTEKSPPAPSSP